MSKYLIEDTSLTSLANAIRSKTNKTNPLTLQTMVNEINSIIPGAKLFSSVNEMNADPDKQEGQLAVVYSEMLSPIKNGATYSQLVFPRIVTLPEQAKDSYIDLTFSSTYVPRDYDRGCFISPYVYDGFYFAIQEERNWETGEEGRTVFYVHYKTSDLINYTLAQVYTPATGDILEFTEDYIWNIENNISVTITFNETSELASKFVLVNDGSCFNGLYKCNADLQYELVGTSGVDTSDANATTEDIAQGKTAYVNGEKVEGNVFTVPEGDSLSLGTAYVGDNPSINSILINTEEIGQNTLLRKNSTVSIKADYGILSSTIELTPEKIVEGNTILGVEGTATTGTDTSDATATSMDLLLGKTAYVNGNKITGVLNNYTNTEVMLPYNTYRNLGDVIEIKSSPRVGNPICYGEGVTVAMQLSTSAVGLIPEDIVSGKTIFGVTGTAKTGVMTQEEYDAALTTTENILAVYDNHLDRPAKYLHSFISSNQNQPAEGLNIANIDVHDSTEDISTALNNFLPDISSNDYFYISLGYEGYDESTGMMARNSICLHIRNGIRQIYLSDPTSESMMGMGNNYVYFCTATTNPDMELNKWIRVEDAYPDSNYVDITSSINTIDFNSAFPEFNKVTVNITDNIKTIDNIKNGLKLLEMALGATITLDDNVVVHEYDGKLDVKIDPYYMGTAQHNIVKGDNELWWASPVGDLNTKYYIENNRVRLSEGTYITYTDKTQHYATPNKFTVSVNRNTDTIALPFIPVSDAAVITFTFNKSGSEYKPVDVMTTVKASNATDYLALNENYQLYYRRIVITSITFDAFQSSITNPEVLKNIDTRNTSECAITVNMT